MNTSTEFGEQGRIGIPPLKYSDLILSLPPGAMLSLADIS